MMYRTSLLLLFLLASGVAAGAGAQEPPHAAAPARVADLRRMQPVSGDARAGAGKAAVCAACHGAQGVAIAPNFPNLAGQSATYLYVQLKEFHDGLRSDPVMSGQAAALSDADMRDLASYYAALAPKPAGRADAASRGAQLYLAGDPAKGIPPRQAATARMRQPRPHPRARRRRRGRAGHACAGSPRCTWPRSWPTSRAARAAAPATRR
ncbi:c-type cytochrome [Rhodanobacter sp. FW106-PBR-LB-2-11]|uniref:c-type cytochrome n=1 Tax=Rhodanobacter sp. FW106-PBR-LB-2-11 TaxID=1524463 RepID=UPI0034E537DE